MATNLDIIKRAMRKLHVLAAGTSPASTQAADAMESLQSLYVELIGNGGLGRLADVVVPSTESDYTPFGWSRVKYTAGTTITMPAYYGDTFENSSDGGFDASSDQCQAFHDLSPIVLIDGDGVAAYWIFNAYSGEWVQVNELDQQDDFPFAEHYVNGFAAMLAEALADDYEAEPKPDTRRQATWCRHALSSKRDSEDNVSPEPNDYF
jgi:hypothetical protein